MGRARGAGPDTLASTRGAAAGADTTTTVETITNPSRNDPCPCQSGLKYKRCCLEQQSLRETLEYSFYDIVRTTGMGYMTTALFDDEEAEKDHFERLLALLPQAATYTTDEQTILASMEETQGRTIPDLALSLQLPDCTFMRILPGIEVAANDDEEADASWLLTGALFSRYAAEGMEVFPIIMIDPGTEIVLKPVAFTGKRTKALPSAVHWRQDRKSGFARDDARISESIDCASAAVTIASAGLSPVALKPWSLNPPKATVGTFAHAFPELAESAGKVRRQILEVVDDPSFEETKRKLQNEMADQAKEEMDLFLARDDSSAALMLTQEDA